jgi:hypothetical protein
MNITYIDSEEKVKTMEKPAFMIEHNNVMSERNNGVQVKSDILGMKYIDTLSMIQFSLFQYMIGNVDWSIAGRHNIKLLKSKDVKLELLFVVPYDFDHAGLVNASYATNVRDPEIESVRTRVFDGICYTEDDYAEEIQRFISLKDDFYAEVENVDQMQSSTKKDVISYLEAFFSLIEQPDFYRKYILPSCRNYDN